MASTSDRYGREVRKANAPSGSRMEFFKQWHLLDSTSMMFLKPHIVPRPVRCSQNICETVTPVLPAVAVQGESQSPAQLLARGHAHEVQVALPLWPLSVLSPISASLPSPSPPFSTLFMATSLPSPSCFTQVSIQKGRKRGSSTRKPNHNKPRTRPYSPSEI